MALPSVIDETVEVRSKSLFGNRHMLRIAGDIAGRTSRFTVQAVAKETQVPYSSAHRLVRQLESLGLVEAAPADPHENHRWYTRATHTSRVAMAMASGESHPSSEGALWGTRPASHRTPTMPSQCTPT